MKTILILACLLLVTSAQVKTTTKSEQLPWKAYTVADEQFSVALPTMPALHTSKPFVDRIRKNRKQWELGCYADGVVYVIYVQENPKPRQSLEDFITERGSGPGQVSESNVTRDGVMGKERSLPLSKVQLFATEDRFYSFGVLNASPDDPRSVKFFSSISLKNKKGGIALVDGPGEAYEPPVQSQPAVDDASSRIFTGRDVTQKARLAMKPEPFYTESARIGQVTGTVVLKCVFSSNGMVTNIRTVAGLPEGLTERAIDAARKIKFIPAMKDGKYVSMWMQLEYNFNLY